VKPAVAYLLYFCRFLIVVFNIDVPMIRTYK